MKYRKLCFLMFICCGLTHDVSAQDATTDSVDLFLQQYRTQMHIPGMQAVVIRHGKIIFSHSYGIANVARDAPR